MCRIERILTNHELPYCMLEEYNKEYNDYDFVLFHLYISDEAYRGYYLTMRESDPDRMMILDCSAYEYYVSGKEFNNEEYNNVIFELKPDYFIIPDVLMDKDKTVKNAYDWVDIINDTVNKFSDIKSKPMYVPQGETIYEFFDCLELMRLIFPNEKACIPFHNKFFYELGSLDTDLTKRIKECLWGKKHHVPTEDDKYAIGRCVVIDMISHWEIDNGRLEVHLLGTHNPVELQWMSYYDNIRTYDTGYPVKLGISEVLIGHEVEKPNVIIDDFYHKQLNKKEISFILYNINKLRDYIMGVEVSEHICFVGSQGTGKTTVRKAVSEKLDEHGVDYVCIDEVVRTLVSEGKLTMEDVNTNCNTKAQSLIFDTYKKHHIGNKDKFYLCDRCVIDPLAYTLYMLEEKNDGDYELYYDQFNQVKELIKCGYLRKIFYVPIEFGLAEDGFRDVDVEFQKRIDTNMRFIISELVNSEVKEMIDIYEITGSVEERASKVLDITFKKIFNK